jgi:hypothetical protein
VAAIDIRENLPEYFLQLFEKISCGQKNLATSDIFDNFSEDSVQSRNNVPHFDGWLIFLAYFAPSSLQLMSEPKARTKNFHFGNFFVAPTDSLISL